MNQTEPRVLEFKPYRVGYTDYSAGSVFGIMFGTAFFFFAMYMTIVLNLEQFLPLAAPLMGLTIILLGVYVLFLQLHPCVLRYYTERRMRELKAIYPTERWSFEYDWNLTGCYPSLGPPEPSWPEWVGRTLFILCLLPMNYYVLFTPRPDLHLSRAIYLIDALVAVYGVYEYWRISNADDTAWFFLHFPSFPFFLGEEIVMELAPNRSLGRYDKIAFTLRCVEERQVEVHRKNNTVWITQCFQIYAETFMSVEPGVVDRTRIPVRFVLPEEAFETSLWHEPPRYWELLVKADTSPPLALTFLLPVYKRNRAAPQPDLIWEKTV